MKHVDESICEDWSAHSLRLLMADRDMTIAGMVTASGLPEHRVYRARRDGYQPRMWHVVAFAGALGVQVGWLRRKLKVGVAR